MRIKVKYRNQWYYVSSLSIDEEGNVSFEYLHGFDGVVDSEHIITSVLYLDDVEMALVKLEKENYNKVKNGTNTRNKN